MIISIEFLTGTCANCKGRFRFEIEEILRSGHSIACPHCGFRLSTSRLKAYAEALKEQKLSLAEPEQKLSEKK